MGTNYYHRTNICQSCGRYDQRHIGKQSIGWEFSFQGYRPWDQYDEETPTILSWSDWKSRLIEGKIFDEYEREISLEDFVMLVKVSKGRENHTDYCMIHHTGFAKEELWKDLEGYSFSIREFS